MTKLKQLRKKIIKIGGDNFSFGIERLITLEDVLIAIKEPYSIYKSLERKNEITIVCNSGIRFIWQLGIDLDHQKPEVWDLLFKLLI